MPKDGKIALANDVLPDGTPSPRTANLTKYCTPHQVLHPSLSTAPLSLPGTIIPAGSLLVYLPWVMGRLDNLWANAAMFNPERWLTMEMAPSPFHYPVFNAGPRLCLGMTMAMVEMKIVTVAILQKFVLRRVSPQPAMYAVTVTLPLLQGLDVMVQRR